MPAVNCQPKLPNSIPRSTKQRWKDKDIQSFWAPYPLKDGSSDDGHLLRLERENAKLKVQVKSLFYLVSTYKDLIALSPAKPAQVLKVRKGIEMLMRSCNGSGLDKVLWRYLPFPLNNGRPGADTSIALIPCKAIAADKTHNSYLFLNRE